VALLLALAFLVPPFGPPLGPIAHAGNPSQFDARPAKAVIGPALLEKAQSTGSIRVIVKLDVDFMPEGHIFSPFAANSQRNRIAQAQDRVLKRLDAFQSRPARRFKHIPYFAVQVNAEALADLLANPLVLDIVEDVPVPAVLRDSVPLIGADDLWLSGYTGAGQTVAILDTGVDGSHPFLQACFSTTYAPSGASTVCPNGLEQQIGTGAGVPCSVNGCYHGTHVAGIAAGKGDDFSGVAPDATLIAVQVFSRFDGINCGPDPGDSPCALSYTSDQMAALDWVYDQRSSFSIAAVNMSLGGGRFTAACDNDTRKPSIDNLLSVGIATTIASGNEYYYDALAAPACISSAISVGATSKSDVAADFSNVSNLLDLFAPGVSIYSSMPGTGYTYLQGTSMAAPHVAGAWALLKSADPSAGVAQVLNALTSTGPLIVDNWGGSPVTKPRIQVDAALDVLVPPTTDTPTVTSTATPTASLTPTATSTPTSTPTSTASSTFTPTFTPTSTSTPSSTPTLTFTPTPTPTPTSTPSSTPTSTFTPTLTPTATPTSAPTETPTATPTGSPTPTPTDTLTPSPTATTTETPPPTATPSSTPTSTSLPTETATSTPTATQTPSGTIEEDLNLDGRVNVLDVQLCVNVFLGIQTDPTIVARADVNGDGAVNVLDVQRIVNKFLAG
jgi:subtilisin family serine protease